MSDFSIFSLFTAGLACMIPFASAYTQPVGANPVGNSITLPGLNSIVPVGKPYTITWDPTTPGTVTLLLLKGPATNLKLQNVIVEMTENDGKYDWTPSSDLEPTDNAKGYGIQLIVDNGAAKGQYQYTTQFGISNPEYKAGSSSGSSSSAPAYSSKEHSSVVPPIYHSATATSTKEIANATTMTSVYAKPTAYTTANGTAPAPYFPKTTGGAATTPYTGSGNGTGVQVSTGGAASLATSAFGLVLAAGVAVIAC